jgi:hypothetical protein
MADRAIGSRSHISGRRAFGGRAFLINGLTAAARGGCTMTANAAETAGALALVTKLVDVGTVDTVYRDVYLSRSRAVLTGVFSIDEFRQVEQQKADLAMLPLTIGRALDRGDWPQVKELGERATTLRRAVDGKRRQVEIAQKIYGDDDVKLDPFSPGMQSFTRFAVKDLLALRSRAIENLSALEREDALWRTFYAGRRSALQALALATDEQSPAAGTSTDPREAAKRALQVGDMRGLVQLAGTLMAATTPKTSRQATTRSTRTTEQPSTDLLTAFPEHTLKEARRLGLAARRLESRPELAALRQYAWNPLLTDEAGMGTVRPVPLPAGTPEGFRDRLEMFMIRPLVNSGGARHLPTLVAEDLLVEDFPDPKEGAEPASSELLKVLGFSRRRGLTRIAIEQALLAHGARVLDQQLGLDPRVFRLVCIPPDVHIRLGEAEKWGQQPLWTHFDGYLLMTNGRPRGLAGGDVRYGGLNHLLGVGRDYDSDLVMARFAVVRRERMSAW